VRLHVRLLSFSLDHNFRVLNEGTLLAILVVDFLELIKIRVDLSPRSYSFAFAPNVKGWFTAADLHKNCEAYLQNLCRKTVDFTMLDQIHPSGLFRYFLMKDFPSMFSTSPGIAKCCPYDIDLSVTSPVPTPPYRCAPLSCQNLSR